LKGEGVELTFVMWQIFRAHIECYKDHRIAMSFATLGCLVPGIVITDKECVDKTFPEFWVAIKNRLGISYEPLTDELIKPQESDSSIAFSERSVVIIGMRGSGKSLCGAALAKKLGWEHIDADNAFVKHTGKTIKDFVAEHGDWKQFRMKEEEVLRLVIAAHPRHTIISTGT